MSNVDLSKVIPLGAREAAIATAQARSYLAETDWYVVRAAETGAPVPEEILAARATARATAGAS